MVTSTVGLSGRSKGVRVFRFRSLLLDAAAVVHGEESGSQLLWVCT